MSTLTTNPPYLFQNQGRDSTTSAPFPCWPNTIQFLAHMYLDSLQPCTLLIYTIKFIFSFTHSLQSPVAIQSFITCSNYNKISGVTGSSCIYGHYHEKR